MHTNHIRDRSRKKGVRKRVSNNVIDREESSNLGSPSDTDLICDSGLFVGSRPFSSGFSFFCFSFFFLYKQQHS